MGKLTLTYSDNTTQEFDIISWGGIQDGWLNFVDSENRLFYVKLTEVKRIVTDKF